MAQLVTGPLSPHGTARMRLLRPEDWPEEIREDEALLRRALEAGFAADRVALALEIAGWQPGLEREDRTALRILVLAALHGLESGNTRIPFQGPEGRGHLAGVVGPLLEGTPEIALGRFERLPGSGLASVLFGEPGSDHPFVVAGPWLYIQRMYELEASFLARFADLLAAPGPEIDLAAVEAALRTVLDDPPLVSGRPTPLVPEQAAAVRAALTRPVTVVSGGPGTGKTSIVVSILRALSLSGTAPERVALAAPTGKAAHRLLESIRTALGLLPPRDSDDRRILERPLEAKTLHRLLGYSPETDSFRHHEGNRLAADLVVVDEASMVDLALMEKLLRALGEGTRLVLLGDADQLPSVGAGAVFRDLAPPDLPLPPYALRLARSFRMDEGEPGGRAILATAQAIRAGRLDLAPVRRIAGPAELAFRGVEFLPAPASARRARHDFLGRWFEERVLSLENLRDRIERPFSLAEDGFPEPERRRLDQLFRHHEASRVLCLTRSLPTGSEAVNEAFHDRLGALLGGREHEFLLGEPVLVERNDYARNLYNGDQGLVLLVSSTGESTRPLAVFRTATGFAAHPLGELKMSRAVAITVHKSQGSEYDHVAILLPDRGHPLLCREIVYTAVTRSRLSVTILGDPAALEEAVSRPLQRYSGVADGIRGRE